MTQWSRREKDGSRSRLIWERAWLALLWFITSTLLGPPAHAAEVSFRNDVMAVLSKAGCNAGACHGNANGKAGFKLSLRGEDLEFDHNALTRDQFGRRINPLSPEESLILLKPTTRVAHEGGKRFTQNSDEYKTLRAWIANGARMDPADTPRLLKIEVSPEEKILMAPARTLQLRVLATFSDGAQRDVTQIAVYEPASPLAKVSADGLVTSDNHGETTVLVRYLQSQVPVRLAFIPERPGFAWKETPQHNYIDEHVFAKLRRLQINPSALCPDEIFMRRAYLDLLGLLPTAGEARAFVSSKQRSKRARLIDQLLQRPEFADFWALKWADLLRVDERPLDQKGMQSFHRWIRQSIATNKPLDQFARELIAARGSTYLHPEANYYRANRDAVTRAEATAQVFLGTRLQCAQCHNHPFDRWTQDDYYSWAAVFGKVQYKVLENRRQDSNDSHEFKGEQIVYVAPKGEVKHPKTGKAAAPRFLGVFGTPAECTAPNPQPKDPARNVSLRNTRPSSRFAPVEQPTDELALLASWIASPQNPFFARAQVNRIWYHLMGRGIVDPIDDFRATNPASHPALLDELAEDFIRHKFDGRHVIRLIMNSRTYQLASEPNDTNRDDDMNYSRAFVRRLNAEQLLDCQHEALGVTPTFAGYPRGWRAAQLPGMNFEKRRREKTTMNDQFLKLFGKPPRLLTCECERSTETTMGQAFNMISGPSINELLANPANRLTTLINSGKTNQEMIDELYWTTLTRNPSQTELRRAGSYLTNSSDRRAAFEDLTWGLLNSKEFVLRR
ncbi:MAG: DUF1553 domain-containing protein [Verrucomicrobiales bacterium]|nr:DUF1553 domain-containing protein [Verrucomicrobiales bacterium]